MTDEFEQLCTLKDKKIADLEKEAATANNAVGGTWKDGKCVGGVL